MNGKVKFFNAKNHFGFIIGEDNTEYFVHQSGLTPGTRLYENDEVSFTVEEGDRGPKAIEVVKTKSAPREERPRRFDRDNAQSDDSSGASSPSEEEQYAQADDSGFED